MLRGAPGSPYEAGCSLGGTFKVTTMPDFPTVRESRLLPMLLGNVDRADDTRATVNRMTGECDDIPEGPQTDQGGGPASMAEISKTSAYQDICSRCRVQP